MTVELRKFNVETGEVGPLIEIVGNGETVDLKKRLSLSSYGWFTIEGIPGGGNISRYTDGMGYDTQIMAANFVRKVPLEKRRKVVAHELTIFDDNNKAIRVIPIDEP
jgi:hypothetical protein